MNSSNKFSFCMNLQQIPVHVAPYFISVVKDDLQYFVLGCSSAITWSNFILHLRYICRYDDRVMVG